MTPAGLRDTFEDMLATRFSLGGLSVAERKRVVDIIHDRITRGLGAVGVQSALRVTMLKPAYFDQEALIALQIVLQESTLSKSRDLLSAVKAGYARLIADIDGFFAEISAKEAQLGIAPIAGKHRPQPYAPKTENEAQRTTRLTKLIAERGWTLPVPMVRNIESGIIRVLTERYPHSLESDFASVVEVIRSRAVAMLEANDGNWPRRKGNWYADAIDELQQEHPALFAPILLRN